MTIPNKQFIEGCLQKILDRAMGAPGMMVCEMVSRERMAVYDKHFRGEYPVDRAFAAVSQAILSGRGPRAVVVWDHLEGNRK